MLVSPVYHRHVSILRCDASLYPPKQGHTLPSDAAVLNAPRNREFRNHLFLRRVNAAHLSRLQQAKIAGERAVHCDLADYEARSREAYRTGTEDPRSPVRKNSVCVAWKPNSGLTGEGNT